MPQMRKTEAEQEQANEPLQVPAVRHLAVECCRAHDFCWEGGPCDLCAIQWPPRNKTTGRFVVWKFE